MMISTTGMIAQIANMSRGPKRSFSAPITGPAIAVAMLPVPPTTASPRAPAFGNRSDVMPSIVGHQNAVPIARSAAAMNAVADDAAWLNRYSPSAAEIAVVAMSAIGDTRWL